MRVPSDLIKVIGRYSLVLLLLTCLFVACSKDKDGLIPDVPVNVRISLQEFQVKNTNGALSINNVGVAGIIIVQRVGDTYVAYDRCSSVNPLQKCAVTVDDSGLTATDACSGAKFSLYDGTPVKAPAIRSLKEYYVTKNSVELIVSN